MICPFASAVNTFFEPTSYLRTPEEHSACGVTVQEERRAQRGLRRFMQISG